MEGMPPITKEDYEEKIISNDLYRKMNRVKQRRLAFINYFVKDNEFY